jgi:hypothetical protein
MRDATEMFRKHVDGDASGEPRRSDSHAGRILSNLKRSAV